METPLTVILREIRKDFRSWLVAFNNCKTGMCFAKNKAKLSHAGFAVVYNFVDRLNTSKEMKKSAGSLAPSLDRSLRTFRS